MVGHVQMEHRYQLELRRIPCSDRLDDRTLHAHGVPVSARFIGSGRTRMAIRTESHRLLLDLHRHVCARRRPNGDSRRTAFGPSGISPISLTTRSSLAAVCAYAAGVTIGSSPGIC